MNRIKSLFINVFPYKNFEFTREFFDYIESNNLSSKDLEIIEKLLNLFILKIESEKEELLKQISAQLEQRGINSNFGFPKDF